MKSFLAFILFLGGLHLSAQSCLPYRESGKWGLIDENNRVILKPKHDFIFNFQDLNYAVFMANGFYGVLNRKGKTILPANYKQIKILNKAFLACKKDQGFELVQAEKGRVLEPIYSNIVSIRENLLLAETDTGKLLLNTNNLNLVWSKDLAIYPTKNFLILAKKDSCVMLDSDLNYVFKSARRDYFPSEEGTHFISELGEYFIAESFKGFFKENTQPVNTLNPEENWFVVRENQLYGVYDPLAKKYLLKPEYDWIERLNDDFYKVKKGTFHGLINKNCDWILPPEFADIFLLDKGFFIQNSSMQCGIASQNGRVIIPMKYDWIADNKNYYEVSLNAKIGIYTKNGSLIESPQYDEIREVDGSYKCYAGPIKNAQGKIVKYKRVVSFALDGGQVSGRVEFKDVGIINISSVNKKVKYSRDRLSIGIDSIYRWKRVEKKYVVKGKNIVANIWGMRDTSLQKFVVKPKYSDIEVFEDRNYTLGLKYNYGARIPLSSPLDELKHFGEYHLIDHDKVNKYPKQKGFFSLAAIYQNSDVMESFMGDHFEFQSLDSLRTWKYSFIDKLNSDSTRRASISGNYKFCSELDPLKLSDSRSFVGRINSAYNEKVPMSKRDRLYFSSEFKNASFKIDKGQWTLVNTDHQRLTPILYDYIDEPIRGIYLSQYKGAWGLISTDSTIIPHQYSELNRMRSKSDSIFISVKKQFVEFLIDSLGNKFIVPEGRRILQKEGDAVLFMEKGKYGLLDKNLEVLLEAEYGRLKYLDHGWYRFRRRGKMGLLKTDGSQIPPNFKDLIPLSSEYVIFFNKRFKGLLNKAGDTLVPAIYDEVLLANDLILTSLKGDFFIMNLNTNKSKKIKGEFEGVLRDQLVFSTSQGLMICDKSGKKIGKISKAVFTEVKDGKLLVSENGVDKVYDQNLNLLFEGKTNVGLFKGNYFSEKIDKEYIIRKFGEDKPVDAGNIIKTTEYGHLVLYKTKGRYHLLDTETGEIHRFPEEVAKIMSFHDLYFRVLNKDRSQAFFNLKARNIYNRKFDACQAFTDGYSVVQDKGEVKIFYRDGKLIEGLVYHKILPLTGGYFNAQILKSYGLVDENHGVLLESDYDIVRFSMNSITQLIKDGDVFYYDFKKQKMIK